MFLGAGRHILSTSCPGSTSELNLVTFQKSSFFDPIMCKNFASGQYQATVLRASEMRKTFFDENKETRVSGFCKNINISSPKLVSKTVLYKMTLKGAK